MAASFSSDPGAAVDQQQPSHDNLHQQPAPVVGTDGADPPSSEASTAFSSGSEDVDVSGGPSLPNPGAGGVQDEPPPEGKDDLEREEKEFLVKSVKFLGSLWSRNLNISLFENVSSVL